MAYSKQTWTNDESAVLDTRMNHIEQGIYDNSLATDKINPSGTATTTAEIEEGQINDVIGFKSLKLKGQTSQETTQGNNLLNIYARHLAGYTETVTGVTFTYNNDGSINAKGTATADINYFIASKGQLGDDIFNGTNYLSGCTGGSLTTFYLQFWADTIGTYPQATTEVATSKTAGVNWNITIGIKNGVTINKTFYPMMCATSGKTFEKYSGEKASPNPDFPQEVNNVSGYNVIGISNKNLIEYSFKGYNITSQGKFETGGTSLDFDVHIAKVKAGTTYTITPATNVIAYFDEKPTITSQAYNNTREVITSTNRLTPTRSGYIAMRTATSNTAQLEKGSTATSYIAHQGNNFEINLGKNLFNKDDSNNTLSAFINGDTGAITSYDITRTLFIPCLPNTTYSFSRKTGTRLIIGTTSVTPSIGGTASNITTNHTANQVTYTTNSSAKYLCVFYYKADTDTITNEEMRDTIQIEKGAIATSYAPYFPPILLGSLGTKTNDIRRKDGKWYWHKEMRKATYNGSEDWRSNMTWDGNVGNETMHFYINTVSDWLVGQTEYKSENFIGTTQTNRNLNLEEMTCHTNTNSVYVFLKATRIGATSESTEAQRISLLKAWLANNNFSVYYQLLTPVDEEITYAPLLRQLDELYNSGLYDETNISQDNSSEAFILDLEACKNNINGIVEYIRR